jgi:hypothetical protein
MLLLCQRRTARDKHALLIHPSSTNHIAKYCKGKQIFDIYGTYSNQEIILEELTIIWLIKIFANITKRFVVEPCYV